MTASKALFFAGGAAITFGLPHLFGLRGEDGRVLYGQYYDINNTLSIFSMVLVFTGLQATSRYISQEQDVGTILVKGLKVFMGLGAFVAAVAWSFGSSVAHLRETPHLTSAYGLAGIIVFFYAGYGVLIGVLNGQRKFQQQAALDAAFTVLKVIFILGFTAAGLAVVGAFLGFAIATVLIFLLAAWRVGQHTKLTNDAPEFVGYAAGILAYTLMFNLTFKLDGLLLKPALLEALNIDRYSEEGGSLPHLLNLPQLADGLMGDYGIAVALSRLPWQATIALTLVAFPLVSRAARDQETKRAARYVEQALRFNVLIVGGVITALLAAPQVLFLLFPASYVGGMVALNWLAPAYFFFSIFNICNTLLISEGRVRYALLSAIITVISLVVFYQIGMNGIASGTEVLAQAGFVNLCAFAMGSCVSGAFVYFRFGALWPWRTIFRLTLVIPTVITLGRLYPVETLGMGIVWIACAALLFVMALTALGEFTKEDLRWAKNIFGGL